MPSFSRRCGPLAASLLFIASASSGQTPNEVDVPLTSGAGTAPPLMLQLTHRTRYAALRDQFRPGLTGNDQALVSRTTFRFEWPRGRFAAVGELQDARAYLTDTESNVSTALVNPVDVLQAHLRVGGRPRDRVEATLGRFSMELGSGRLIAQEAYRDVTRTFTGASVRWHLGKLDTLRGFFTFPVVTLPEERPALLDNKARLDREHINQRLWGAWYERSAIRSELRAETYLYALDEHDTRAQPNTRDRKLWTVGGRLVRGERVGKWDTDIEGAWQTGHAHASSSPLDFDALRVSAHYVHASAGRTFRTAWAPRAAVEYDYGSGDSDPGDHEWNRFDALFGNRRVDLSPTSIYGALGRENIDTAGARVAATPSQRTDAFAVYRWVGLASATDSFASSGVRDPSGTSGRDAARQLDVRFRLWIVPNTLRVETGVTRLWRSRFLRDAPNATRSGDTTFFYSDVTYTRSNSRRDRP